MLWRIDNVEQLKYIPMLHFLQNQNFSHYRFFPGLLSKFEFFINLDCDNHPCSFMHSLFNICVCAGTQMVGDLVVSNDCVIAGLVIACFSLFFLVNNSCKHLLVKIFNFKVAFLLHNGLNKIGLYLPLLCLPVLFY